MAVAAQCPASHVIIPECLDEPPVGSVQLVLSGSNCLQGREGCSSMDGAALLGVLDLVGAQVVKVTEAARWAPVARAWSRVRLNAFL
eukprot:7012193-Alexandrium_andersonii.AAC.1